VTHTRVLKNLPSVFLGRDSRDSSAQRQERIYHKLSQMKAGVGEWQETGSARASREFNVRL
jgi:hypothetical protein